MAVEDEATGLDPAQASDENSRFPVLQVYQTLYQYNYLKRPYEVEPLLADTLPTISKDGLTYTIRLRPNVYFHDDPAFGQEPRRLKASDVVYSIQRLADPHVKSTGWWILDGRVLGLNEFRTKLETEKPPVNYALYPVAGLTAPDDRTVLIKLARPYKQLINALATLPASVVAREVVEKYGQEFLNHPVGTGPFVFKEWVRGQRFVFERNTHYWGDRYPAAGETDDGSKGLLKAAGQTLPLADEVVLSIFLETQPRWLNFLKGNLDYTLVPKEAFEDLFDSKLNTKPEYEKKGIVVSKTPNLDVLYFDFNMTDPLVGKNKFLRQAISSVINRDEELQLFYKGRAVVAQGPIPPGIFGYDPDLKDPNGYNLEKARRLAAQATTEYHQQGGRGDIPPIVYNMLNNALDRQIADSLMQDLAKIGLKMERRIGTWPQFQERLMKSEYQFALQSWMADYPDPENFMQLLYSKNRSPGPNVADFSNAHYDALYEQMRDMEDGPNRAKIIREMVKIIHEEVPWVFLVHRMKVIAAHKWLKNFKYHSIDKADFKYLDIDLREKEQTLPLLK